MCGYRSLNQQYQAEQARLIERERAESIARQEEREGVTADTAPELVMVIFGGLDGMLPLGLEFGNERLLDHASAEEVFAHTLSV